MKIFGNALQFLAWTINIVRISLFFLVLVLRRLKLRKCFLDRAEIAKIPRLRLPASNANQRRMSALSRAYLLQFLLEFLTIMAVLIVQDDKVIVPSET